MKNTNEITIEQLAFVLGVTRQTVYNRYSGKNKNLVQIAERAILDEQSKVDTMRQRLDFVRGNGSN